MGLSMNQKCILPKDMLPSMGDRRGAQGMRHHTPGPLNPSSFRKESLLTPLYHKETESPKRLRQLLMIPWTYQPS